MASHQRRRWFVVGLGVLLVAIVAVGVAERGGSGAQTSAPTTTTGPTPPPPPKSLTPLKAPTTTATQDAEYLSEVTEADPALASYERQSGDVALRSLLTDGSAFCAFLNRSDNIDTAMVSVALGARQDQSQTHLPSSVTTFNAIDSVALLTLCPSLESVVPAADLAKIRSLGAELSPQAN
jgi:hypothetical protein